MIITTLILKYCTARIDMNVIYLLINTCITGCEKKCEHFCGYSYNPFYLQRQCKCWPGFYLVDGYRCQSNYPHKSISNLK